MVEHSTADREVPGSNPGAPYFFLHIPALFSYTGYIVPFWFKSRCPLLFLCLPVLFTYTGYVVPF